MRNDALPSGNFHPSIRERLRREALENAARDLAIAAEWSALDDDALAVDAAE